MDKNYLLAKEKSIITIKNKQKLKAPTNQKH